MKTFSFEHFSDIEPGYTRVYSDASPYDRHVMSDMEMAECYFSDIVPEQKKDMGV